MAIANYTGDTTFNPATGVWMATNAASTYTVDSGGNGIYDIGEDIGVIGSPLYSGYAIVNGVHYPVVDFGGVLRVIGISHASGVNLFTDWQYTAAPDPSCFLQGTLIAAVDGERLVETLEIGAIVMTAGGKPVTVKWIGRQKVSTRFGPAERLMPVRIAAGALGDGLPHTDLTVTADHGMLVDGVICHAGALVNGTSITRVPLAEMGESYSVYHVETEEHEIILANGAPAETFIDNVGRQAFDNYAEFEALYGEVEEMAELPYPRAMSPRQVPALISARLAGRRVA